jgi:hypothetical protein
MLLPRWHTLDLVPPRYRAKIAGKSEARALLWLDALPMMYRKASPRPTRFVLKIVTAGAGAVLSIACSSSGVEGSAPVMGAIDSGAPDAGDASHPCDPNPCGVVANPEAGDEHQLMGLVDAGIVPNPEAGDEQPVGVVPNPEAGDEHEGIGLDGAVGVVANPEAGND